MNKILLTVVLTRENFFVHGIFVVLPQVFLLLLGWHFSVKKENKQNWVKIIIKKGFRNKQGTTTSTKKMLGYLL